MTKWLNPLRQDNMTHIAAFIQSCTATCVLINCAKINKNRFGFGGLTQLSFEVTFNSLFPDESKGKQKRGFKGLQLASRQNTKLLG